MRARAWPACPMWLAGSDSRLQRRLLVKYPHADDPTDSLDDKQVLHDEIDRSVPMQTIGIELVADAYQAHHRTFERV